MNTRMQSWIVQTKRSLRRTKTRAIVGGVAALLIAAAAYAGLHESKAPTESMPLDSAVQPHATTHPVLVSGSSSIVLLGTVQSNETANIYPRRDGVVEDVYVDIGDSVKKGQVVALLLSKGVEGQSAAAIATKKAQKAQTEADYLNAQSVKEETLLSTEQKINEKQTALYIAQKEQESLLKRFAEQEAQIGQMREQAFTSVRTARQVVEQIITGSNSRAGSDIQESNLRKQLGLLGSADIRYQVPPLFNQLYAVEQRYTSASDREKELLIDQLFAVAERALTSTVTLLGATPTVPNKQSDLFTVQDLTTDTSRVLSAQDTILKSKEKLQDAYYAFSTLTSAEPELYQAYRVGKQDGAKSNKVSQIESELQTATKNLELTESMQTQMVERQKNMIDVADAMLQSEYAQSGHRQILSPFTGIVSKRFISVGQIVMMSMPTFELTDVQTSLSKKAKAEIQFGLPENLQSAIQVGDTLTFYLQADEMRVYEAVVTRKSPQIDLQTRTVTVQAKVPDELNLPHQTSVRIRIVDESKPLFRVPSLAVKREEGGNFVWIEDEAGDPTKKFISVVAEDGEFADINGDITSETVVLLTPPDLFIPSSADSESL